MTFSQGNFAAKLNQLHSLHRMGKLAEAEKGYLDLLQQPIGRSTTLASLAQLYQQTQRGEKAAGCLRELIALEPTEIIWRDHLADVLGRLDKMVEAAECYQEFLKLDDQNANAWFNFAWRLRHAEDYKGAIEAYDKALALGISGAEEVYLNKAVIFSDHLRQEDQAIACLQQALSINPGYTSALFNLGNLKEEAGDREGALMLFKTALDIDPHHFEALARLADIETFSNISDPIIQQMKQAVKVQAVPASTQANLFFALGKALNDCGDWENAFQNYSAGNRINKSLLGAYDAPTHTRYINDIIDIFNHDWFAAIEPVSDFAPVFICGMFRSGSTLIEQVLAGHPDVTAGGERDFFPRAIKAHFSPYPASVKSINFSMLKEVADSYEQELLQTFGAGALITDKRPDNFLYLGLIKTLFPKARIIFTTRDARDNCLSAFFQRLGRQMLYANDLTDLAHFYQQHQRLMDHWKTVFGQNIHTVQYDKFINDPEKQTRELLDFLGLNWNAECLEFHTRTNHVKTASVWQVRQPLYKKSSGRWKNYEPYIAPLLQVFPPNS